MTIATRCALLLLSFFLGTSFGAAATVADRERIYLNGTWLVHLGGDEWRIPEQGYRLHRVPGKIGGSWEKEFIDERDSHECGWYRLDFAVPAEWKDRRITIDFVRVGCYAKVYLDGRLAGDHPDGNTPFSVDLTGRVVPGGVHRLHVFVQGWSRFSRGRGDCVWPTVMNTQVGLVGDVTLSCSDRVYVEDAFVQTSVRKKTLTATVCVRNTALDPQTITLTPAVWLNNQKVFSITPATLTLGPGETKKATFSRPWTDPKLWGYEPYGTPTLYHFEAALSRDGKTTDRHLTRFGFREFWIEGNQFILNGRPIFLQGEQAQFHMHVLFSQNRQYLYQYFRALRQANVNFIRLPHQVFFPIWAEIADEMGMLLENESMGGIPTPGTGQDLASGAAVLSAKAESAWLDNPSQAAHLQTVTGWVREWRNHPSLILWSTDNESGSQSGAADPDVFKFQRRIKQGILALDPTRPVDHQGSPLTSAAKKFGVDIVPDIYNIHPYADPITLDVDKFSKRHFYSGQPIFIGELFNDYPKINFTPADMAQRPKEVWEKTQSFTEYWHRNILAAKKAGYAGTVLLSLAHSAFWGYIDDKHWVGSPFGRTQGDISVPWPSLSGPDPKIAIYTDWIPWDNLNWFDTTRPVFTPTHVFNRVRDAYRQINGGDLPALPNTRNPELIVTLRYKSKPLPEAVVYLIPADSQPVLPVGVRTDAEGKAWFQADTPGRYNLEYRGNSQVQTLAIDLPRGAFDGKPGYHHVKFLTFDISGPPAQLVANVPDTAPASEPDVIWKCLPVEEKPKAAAKIHDAPNYIDLTAAIDEDGNLSKKAKAFGLKVFLKGKEVTHTLKPWGAGIGIYPDSSKHDTFELFMPAGKPGRYELIVHDPLLSPELSVDLYVGEDQKPRLTLNTNAADLGLQFAVARRGAKFILTLTQKDIVNGKVKLRFVATCWCPAYLRGLTLKLIS